MPWFIPETQLDTVEQIPFLNTVSNSNQNFWLKGFAGRGKSVLLIHCLLREKQKNPDAKIIIVLYTHSLIDMIKEGIPNQYSNTRVVTFYKFRNIHEIYDLILVDEIQDIPEHDLREINSKGKRVIVAGDINQSIWDNPVPSDTIRNTINANVSTLNRIYRLSRRIRSISAPFCEDATNYRNAQVMSLGNAEVPVTLVKANNQEEEYKWLWLAAKEYATAGYVPAILIANHENIISFINGILSVEGKPLLTNEMTNRADRDYTSINSHLLRNGLKVQYLGNKFGSFDDAHRNNLVTIMTYHSSKGLDFKTVFIPFLNIFYNIWGEISRAKSLFFVALTRSREQLLLSYSGEHKHSFLTQNFVSECNVRNAQDEINRMTNPIGNVNTNDDEIILI